jgi:hypothetical protein
LKDGRPASDPAGADAGGQEKSPSPRRGQDVPVRGRKPPKLAGAVSDAMAKAEQPAGFDVLCLSGRGDKDLAEAVARLQELDE